MTIHIHIGVHKTGSTALQKWAHLNRELLRSQGVLYPYHGRPDNPDIEFGHHAIAWSVSQRWPTGDVLPALLREIDESDCTHVLLSSEEFDRLTQAQIEDLAKLLGPEIKVVFYYRRQSYVLQALYGTDISFNQVTKSIDDYIDSEKSIVDFFDIASRWANVFGNDNVITLRYDRDLFIGGDIISDFFTRVLNIEINNAAVPEEANPSLPWYFCLTLQHMWRMKMDRQLVYCVADILQRNVLQQGSASAQFAFLPPSKARALDDSFARSNKEFRETFCPDHALLEPVSNLGDEAWYSERSGGYAALHKTLAAMLPLLRRGTKASEG